MKIRCINSKDAAAFSKLRREVTQENPASMGLTYDEELTRTLDSFQEQLSFQHPNIMYGSFLEGELVATAAVGYISKLASSRHKILMWGVFTSPRYRRRGYSRQVVDASIKHAFKNGVNRVNLQVYIPNKPAIALYKSLGFVEYGVEPDAVHINGRYYDSAYMTLVRF